MSGLLRTAEEEWKRSRGGAVIDVTKDEMPPADEVVPASQGVQLVAPGSA